MVLIDSSILIKGQRDPVWFASVIDKRDDLATSVAAVAEFEVGLYAPRDKKTRDQVREFSEAAIAPLMRIPVFPDDFHEAARLVGEAIFNGEAKPSMVDGLIAACARRTNRIVWTTDETDFKAMGCDIFDPWTSSKHPPGQSAAR